MAVLTAALCRAVTGRHWVFKKIVDFIFVQSDQGNTDYHLKKLKISLLTKNVKKPTRSQSQLLDPASIKMTLTKGH